MAKGNRAAMRNAVPREGGSGSGVAGSATGIASAWQTAGTARAGGSFPRIGP